MYVVCVGICIACMCVYMVCIMYVFCVCAVVWYVYVVCPVCMHVVCACVCAVGLPTSINEMKITPAGTPGVHLLGDSRAHKADNSSSVPLTSPV